MVNLERCICMQFVIERCIRIVDLAKACRYNNPELPTMKRWCEPSQKAAKQFGTSIFQLPSTCPVYKCTVDPEPGLGDS